MKKVIVIGAGILGATAAYKLAKLGANVIVIDRNDQGQATDAAAGIICPWLAQRRNKAWYELARAGAHMYPNLINELTKDGETETGYKRVGALGLHTDEQRLIATEERVLKRRQHAPEIGDINLLDKSETNKLFPLLDDKYQSIHITGAARVDGRALRNALMSAAVKHGATVIKGNAHLLQKGSRIIGARVMDEEILADMVIATSGAWMRQLLTPLDVHFNVKPQKAQIIHLHIPNLDTSKYPVVMPPNNQYVLPFDQGKIIIGATHETDAEFDNRVTVGGVNEVLSKALEVAPGLSEGTILETRVGFRPFTPGSLPVIGSLPNFDGLILANGLGATGLTMGPYIGTELAKLALGMKLDVDLTHYDVAEALE